jgi:D-aspartate ligase
MSRLPEFVYPCILKPRLKNDAFRQHSPKKAFRVNSKEELLKTYEMVAVWEKEVVIQEWIGGTDERIGFCLSYCNREAIPLALFPGRKLIQWHVSFGNTAISEPAPREWANPIITLTREIWKTVGYQGLGSIEYKMRVGSDTPVIIEPTVGRTDFQSELAVLNGVNIPAIAYSDLARVPLPAATKPVRLTKLVDGPSHWRAARVFMSQPRELGIRRWLMARNGRKRYMILRAEDYHPFLSSLYMRLRGIMGDLLERLVGTRLKRRLAGKLAR